MISLLFIARKRSLEKGNVLTRVCHSVHGGGGSLYDVSSCLAPLVPCSFGGGAVSGPMFLPRGVEKKQPCWTETPYWTKTPRTASDWNAFLLKYFIT